MDRDLKPTNANYQRALALIIDWFALRGLGATASTRIKDNLDLDSVDILELTAHIEEMAEVTELDAELLLDDLYSAHTLAVRVATMVERGVDA